MLPSVRKRKQRYAFVILLFISFLWVMPLVWGVSTSFKTGTEISLNPIRLFPENPTLIHYENLFSKTDTPVLRWMLNSFIIASTHTILYLFVASFAAYAFSILKFNNTIKKSPSSTGSGMN